MYRGVDLIHFAAWTVFGLILASQFYMQFELRGEPVPWGNVLRAGLFESYLWAFATLAIFWLTRRFPLERERMLRSSAVHLAERAAERLEAGLTEARLQVLKMQLQPHFLSQRVPGGASR